MIFPKFLQNKNSIIIEQTRIKNISIWVLLPIYYTRLPIKQEVWKILQKNIKREVLYLSIKREVWKILHQNLSTKFKKFCVKLSEKFGKFCAKLPMQEVLKVLHNIEGEVFKILCKIKQEA